VAFYFRKKRQEKVSNKIERIKTEEIRKIK
jgi:hypothetical protein